MKFAKLWIVSVLSLLGAVRALAEEHTITQKGKAFSTGEITIKAGDSVKFQNDDDTAHNVFSSTSAHEFNVGIQKSGVAGSQKFDKPGEVEVRCAIHPQMKLKVNVK